MRWSERMTLAMVAALVALVLGGEFLKARAQSAPTYRVIGASKDSTLEKELNEAARQGCEPLMAVGAGYAGEGMLVLRCP